jgi:chemotaxis protein CheC
MPNNQLLTKEELGIWTWLVSKGIGNAMTGLSAMIGTELVVTDLRLQQYPIEKATQLLGVPENVLAGIYLTVDGDAPAHLILAHDLKVAHHLVNIQKGNNSEVNPEIGEMGKSVMAEMGNITGSYFLNALADATDMKLTHSPPEVIIDMAGATLSVALVPLMQEQEEVMVVQTTFGSFNRQIDGVFLVLPTMAFLQAIIKKCSFVRAM